MTLSAKKPPNRAYPKKLVTIGDHIKKRRLDLGLFQKDVALTIGVDTYTVTNWEKGRSSPTLRVIPRILEFLGYNPLNHSFKEMTLGEMIRLHRNALGISQKRLAQLLGVDWSTVAHWERGKTRPSRRLEGPLSSFLDEQSKNSAHPNGDSLT